METQQRQRNNFRPIFPNWGDQYAGATRNPDIDHLRHKTRILINMRGGGLHIWICGLIGERCFRTFQRWTESVSTVFSATGRVEPTNLPPEIPCSHRYMSCVALITKRNRNVYLTVELFFLRIFSGKYANSFWPISVNFGQFWRCRGALLKNNVFERFNVFLRTEKITYLSERRVPWCWF